MCTTNLIGLTIFLHLLIVRRCYQLQDPSQAFTFVLSFTSYIVTDIRNAQNEKVQLIVVTVCVCVCVSRYDFRSDLHIDVQPLQSIRKLLPTKKEKKDHQRRRKGMGS